MANFVKRVCTICGHRTDSIVGCGRDGCDKADDTSLALRAAIHDHCRFEQTSPEGGEGHGLCTAVGCMAESVPLGLVNPDIVTGEVPRHDSTSSQGTGLDG